MLAHYISSGGGAYLVSANRELAFSINDAARLLRTYADQKAAAFGMTRAKWAVLARLDRFEGLKQSELAEMLDLQPITLTRLLDGLCDNGLIERRPRAAARSSTPTRLTGVRERLMCTSVAAARGRVNRS